jgi:hypothetical protein
MTGRSPVTTAECISVPNPMTLLITVARVSVCSTPAAPDAPPS